MIKLLSTYLIVVFCQKMAVNSVFCIIYLGLNFNERSIKMETSTGTTCMIIMNVGFKHKILDFIYRGFQNVKKNISANSIALSYRSGVSFWALSNRISSSNFLYV